MSNVNKTVLKFMLDNARGGKTEFGFFDLRYELGLKTPTLLGAIEALKRENEIVALGDTTYRFSGSLSERDWEKEPTVNAEAEEEVVFERRRSERHIRDIIEEAKKRGEKPSNPEDDELEKFFSEHAPQEEDEYIRALDIAVTLGSVSCALLQRKLCVGFNHANLLLERMEREGHVKRINGRTSICTTLLTREEFKKRYGGSD